MIKKFLFLTCTFAFCLLPFAFCSAKEITILYTGETHAALYPCDCPLEPDGGVARRAALVKEIRKNNPDALLLDSGGFFAGGLLDEHTQNSELDMQRTRVNLKAMELMKYDAVAVGDDEFNFGREFLSQNTGEVNLNFISCNIKSESLPKISPYIIKEIEGIKIGIIGVTTLQVKQKAESVEFIEARIAVKQAVDELRKKNVNIVVLLSHLGEAEDLNLIKEVKGIDILITGHSRRAKEEPFLSADSTLVLRSSWQGRRLGKVSFSVAGSKITNYKVEELRLSDKIKDEPQALRILPDCFADRDCKKKGFLGACQNAGTLNARCLFGEASKVNLLVIAPKACRACNTDEITGHFKKHFPGLALSYLYYPGAKAGRMIKEFNFTALPVYLLGKEIEKEKVFDTLKQRLEAKGDFYMLKPEFGGISYFLNRKKEEGRLDLFISLYDKDMKGILDSIKEIKPAVHFLAAEQQPGRLDAAKGEWEVEEYLRAVCVQKYYPEKFFDYISCRLKNINSSWWEDCLAQGDSKTIKVCAKSEEGKNLLKQNIGLNKELGIMSGPTYLLDNQEIFGLSGTPSREDFKKIFSKK